MRCPLSWLRTIIRHMDYIRGRFETVEANTPELRAACLEILDEVRSRELNRVHGSSSLETGALAHHEVSDQRLATRVR